MLRTLSRRLKQWPRDNVGVAAVEMAIIAPVALILLSVGVASGQALEIYHKVVLTAHTITDLVSRTPYSPDATTPSAEDLAASQLITDMAMSQMTMYPYSASSIQIVMSELLLNTSTNQGTVVWSQGYNGATALKTGAAVNLNPSYVAALNPPSVNSGPTYLLYGQVSYSYQPFEGMLTLPSITFSANELLTIRNAPEIIMD